MNKLDLDKKNKTMLWIVGIVLTAALGASLAWAGGQGGQQLGSWPVFSLLVITAYVINWLVFIPSFFNHTEKYFDLTGSITYYTVTIGALLLASDLDARALISGLLVLLWAGRLGTFLFKRIKKDGKDGRFDTMKYNFWEYLMTWTIQGLWVSLTAAAALMSITAPGDTAFGILGFVGLAIWIIGFSIEVSADKQKSKFLADPKNKGRFINVGLWSWSRHPNYFGEIVLWTGMAIMSIPILEGWRWVALVSPVFVYFLLTRVSGIPIQKRRAEERWGSEKAFRKYMDSTPALIPLRPKNTSNYGKHQQGTATHNEAIHSQVTLFMTSLYRQSK